MAGGNFRFKSDVALKETVKKQLSKYESENAKVVNLKHVACTLYAIELSKSSFQIGSNDVVALLGEKSPVRFKKIKNFRVVVDSELFGPDTKEEWGFETDTQLSIQFLPGLVEPETQSLIIFDHIPNVAFKVLNSNMVKVLNTTYVQSNISVETTVEDPSTWEWIEKQVVKDYTLTKYRDGMFVLSDENANVYDKMGKIVMKLLEEYTSTFYNKILNSFVLQENTTLTYDPYLYHFIKTNAVTSDLEYKKFWIPTQEILFESGFEGNYFKSIFSFIEKKPDPELMIDSDITTRQLSFSRFSIPFDKFIWSRFDNLDITYFAKQVSRDMKFNNEVMKYKETPEYTQTQLDIIINKYINNALKYIDFIALYKYEIENTYEDYIKYAICIHIAKQYALSIRSVDINNDLIRAV